MTPEQRLDRVERILGHFVREGRRWRVRSREQDEKINILIQTQMDTEEIMKRLATSQAELAESQKLTDKALRAFINSHQQRENGKS